MNSSFSLVFNFVWPGYDASGCIKPAGDLGCQKLEFVEIVDLLTDNKYTNICDLISCSISAFLGSKYHC